MKEETKCYCGHTTYCDCGPKEETLEEVAIIHAFNFYEKEDREVGKQSFIEGYELAQERSYSEEDMKSFADWCRNGLLNTEYSVDRLNEHLEQWKQFKK